MGFIGEDLFHFQATISQSGSTFEEFIRDPEHYGSAERFLQLGIDAITGIGSHVIADLALGVVNWHSDIPAILAIEDLDDFNPYYHTANDRLEYLNLVYYAEMIKASLATLAHLGCLVEEGWGTVFGIVTNTITGQPIVDASISIFNPTWGYTFNTASDRNGEYSSAALSGVHSITFDAVGYAPQTITDVIVIKDQTTITNTALVPIEESVTYLTLINAGTAVPLPDCP